LVDSALLLDDPRGEYAVFFLLPALSLTVFLALDFDDDDVALAEVFEDPATRTEETGVAHLSSSAGLLAEGTLTTTILSP